MISLDIISCSQFRNNSDEGYIFHKHEKSWNKKHTLEADIEGARQRLKREADIQTGIKERYFKKYAKAIFDTANIFIESKKLK